ncbi:hypothetical protein GCM10007989_36590 [Devosia pacifica]|uniref:Uncharacterized protein n=1 Tax=Devosia pacifica TaxID=1335967 RepID=A0A918VYE7_9HYPH|nr:hypothetical protein [Devosia pacifica]GHA37113.1 hypothetical protein GCM10007989_36590 [Devosia pacifica]
MNDDKGRAPKKPENEKRQDTQKTNEDLNQEFERDKDDLPPGANEPGGLRGGPD